MEPLENVFKNSADATGLGDVYLVGELGVKWSEVVGGLVAQKSTPLRITDRTLLIKTASPGWSHQLSMLKSTIITKLKTWGLEIDDLRFVFVTEAPEKNEAVPALKKSPPDYSSVPDSIDAQALRLAIASYLGTKSVCAT